MANPCQNEKKITALMHRNLGMGLCCHREGSNGRDEKLVTKQLSVFFKVNNENAQRDIFVTESPPDLLVSP